MRHDHPRLPPQWLQQASRDLALRDQPEVRARVCGWHSWRSVAIILNAKDDEHVQPRSALLLAIVEGAVRLEATGEPELGELAVNGKARGFGSFVR